MPPKKKTTPRKSTPPPRAGGGGRSGRRPPPPVMVSRPKPWGLIALTLAVVVFAGLVIGYAVFRVNKSNENTPEAKAEDARAIPGIVVKDFPNRNHVQGVVSYTDSPPFGGDHDPTWADCNGTVYPTELRKENAVHMLEHGAAAPDGSGGAGLALNSGFVHDAPNSGVTVWLSRRSLMKRSTRSSLALSTNS